jgi:hypothetical protein
LQARARARRRYKVARKEDGQEQDDQTKSHMIFYAIRGGITVGNREGPSPVE